MQNKLKECKCIKDYIYLSTISKNVKEKEMVKKQMKLFLKQKNDKNLNYLFDSTDNRHKNTI